MRALPWGAAPVPVARVLEAVPLLASFCLLLWLGRAREAASPSGFLGHPAASLLAVLAVLWLLPGFVLWRLSSRARRSSWLEALPLCFGLGLAWLLLPAAVAMAGGSDIDTLARVVTGLNGGLVTAYLAARFLERQPASADVPAEAPRESAWSPWLLGAALLAAARLLLVPLTRVNRFTFGGDEWVYMKVMRRFLDAPSVADPDFDVWDLVLALLVKFSRVDVLDAYRIVLPPVLVLVAILAFLLLAKTLLGDVNAVCFALVLQAILCLSDMHTRGEGAGMGLLARIMEDKYVAVFIAVPLSQAAFLNALRSGRRSSLVVFAGLSMAATLLHPFAIPWLALSCGSTYLAGLITGRVPRRRALLWSLGGLLATATSLGWWLRSLRPAAYFRLYDPGWPFNATLLELGFRQLLILSLEKGWYMAHPWLLHHPLMIAAILVSPLLLPRFKQSVSVQFLVLSTLVPLLVAFNPPAATLLGAWVTPWRLYWVLWVVPVALLLGHALDGSLAAVERLAAARWVALGRIPLLSGLLGALALAAVSGLLDERMAESLRALKTRNRVAVREDEKEFMRALAGDPRLRGMVLAPDGPSIHLPSWTSRLTPLPGLEAFRNRDEGLLEECADFYASKAIGAREVLLLQRRRVDYVIAETGSPVDAAMRGLPGPFRPLYRNRALSLYAWRPRYWMPSAPR